MLTANESEKFTGRSVSCILHNCPHFIKTICLLQVIFALWYEGFFFVVIIIISSVFATRICYYLQSYSNSIPNKVLSSFSSKYEVTLLLLFVLKNYMRDLKGNFVDEITSKPSNMTLIAGSFIDTIFETFISFSIFNE